MAETAAALTIVNHDVPAQSVLTQKHLLYGGNKSNGLLARQPADGDVWHLVFRVDNSEVLASIKCSRIIVITPQKILNRDVAVGKKPSIRSLSAVIAQ